MNRIRKEMHAHSRISLREIAFCLVLELVRRSTDSALSRSERQRIHFQPDAQARKNRQTCCASLALQVETVPHNNTRSASAPAANISQRLCTHTVAFRSVERVFCERSRKPSPAADTATSPGKRER